MLHQSSRELGRGMMCGGVSKLLKKTPFQKVQKKEPMDKNAENITLKKWKSF